MNTKISVPKIKIHQGGNPHWVGNGFPVRSIFGYNDLGQELSPFLLLDYAAPYFFPPGNEKRGVGEHPHRGFETVTIAYQGEIEHRDSSGAGGKIGPGDVQWMTAASGLVHEEFHSRQFTAKGGTFEMVQLWVNLPAKFKSASPRYQTLLNADIPRVELADGKAELRVIAGSFHEKHGPAKTFTPINMGDISVRSESAFSLPFEKGYTKAVLVLQGEVTTYGERIDEGKLLILNRHEEHVEISAAKGTKLLVLSGEPINEPIVGYGPFVMTSDAEIRQAFVDFQSGKFGVLRPNPGY